MTDIMSQAAHSEDWPPAVRKHRGERRFRFEVGRSQLLVLTAVLALLATLFFLSGLAIGLLMHPRVGSTDPRVQTEVRQPVTAPRPPVRSPAQSPTWVSADDPPEDVDLAEIVWQPRRTLEAWERAPAEVPSSQTSNARATTPTPETSLETAEPAARIAQAEPVVDPIFEPRPGGLAQPPRRWRQAQPLAAAYLTAPEETALPPTTDPGTIDPGASSDPSERVDETPQMTSDLAEPVEGAGLDVDADAETGEETGAETLSRWTAAQTPRTPSTQGEDTGWRPASSHWQSFYDDLWSDHPKDSSATATLADTEPWDAEPQDAFTAEEPTGTVGDSFTASSAVPAVPAVTEDLEPLPGSEREDGAQAARDEGWQPSSNLWQSFLDDPYDWTADRLPKQATRRSAAPRGSMQVPYGDLMDRAARRHGLDVALVAALVRVESDYDPQAVSHRGARGLMQVMPATAERFGVAADELFDPAVNLDVGMRYLAWLEDRFEGDTERMLAAYNAGEAAVDTYDGVPPYGETQRYVQRIYRLMGWEQAQ